MLPEVTSRFNAILIKIPKAFFSEMEKAILHLYGTARGSKKRKQRTKKNKKRTKQDDSHFPITKLPQSNSKQDTVILA